MNSDTPEADTPPLKAAWGRSRRMGLFLMAAMFLVCLLGVQVVQAWGDPRRVALYLTVYFVFFAVVILRALLECIDILRERLSAQQQLFRMTLGAGAPHELPGRGENRPGAD